MEINLYTNCNTKNLIVYELQMFGELRTSHPMQTCVIVSFTGTVAGTPRGLGYVVILSA
jgi:hypothetical protein